MTILLVDDEKDCLDDIVDALEPTGYVCKSTVNPLKAIEIYKDEKTDVVISDIRMPEMNGIELLKKIRDFDPQARVIIVTAYGDLETARAAINNRAYAFFGKPIDFQELIMTLRTIENEIDSKNKVEVDYENLKDEHTKLKSAYDELMKVIKSLETEK
jgi:DNA-binding NtrC family response regulator